MRNGFGDGSYIGPSSVYDYYEFFGVLPEVEFGTSPQFDNTIMRGIGIVRVDDSTAMENPFDEPSRVGDWLLSLVSKNIFDVARSNSEAQSLFLLVKDAMDKKSNILRKSLDELLEKIVGSAKEEIYSGDIDSDDANAFVDNFMLLADRLVGQQGLYFLRSVVDFLQRPSFSGRFSRSGLESFLASLSEKSSGDILADSSRKIGHEISRLDPSLPSKLLPFEESWPNYHKSVAVSLLAKMGPFASMLGSRAGVPLSHDAFVCLGNEFSHDLSTEFFSAGNVFNPKRLLSAFISCFAYNYALNEMNRQLVGRRAQIIKDKGLAGFVPDDIRLSKNPEAFFATHASVPNLKDAVGIVRPSFVRFSGDSGKELLFGNSHRFVWPGHNPDDARLVGGFVPRSIEGDSSAQSLPGQRARQRRRMPPSFVNERSLASGRVANDGGAPSFSRPKAISAIGSTTGDFVADSSLADKSVAVPTVRISNPEGRGDSLPSPSAASFGSPSVSSSLGVRPGNRAGGFIDRRGSIPKRGAVAVGRTDSYGDPHNVVVAEYISSFPTDDTEPFFSRQLMPLPFKALMETSPDDKGRRPAPEEGLVVSLGRPYGKQSRRLALHTFAPDRSSVPNSSSGDYALPKIDSSADPRVRGVVTLGDNRFRTDASSGVRRLGSVSDGSSGISGTMAHKDKSANRSLDTASVVLPALSLARHHLSSSRFPGQYTGRKLPWSDNPMQVGFADVRGRLSNLYDSLVARETVPVSAETHIYSQNDAFNDTPAVSRSKSRVFNVRPARDSGDVSKSVAIPQQPISSMPSPSPSHRGRRFDQRNGGGRRL